MPTRAQDLESSQDARPVEFPAVILLVTFLATAALAVIVPFIWHANLYVDGRRTLNTAPSIEVFGSSYQSAAWLLRSIFFIASIFGGASPNYGISFDLSFFVTNFVFGWAFLGGVALLLGRLRGIVGAAPVVITMVLLTPFMYNVSKELVFFLACVLALRFGIRRRDGILYIDIRAIILLVVFFAGLLGIIFRAYYLIFAVILLINVWVT